MDRSIHEFCSKHNVSLDWLMGGDLKGLQRMKQWADEKNRDRAGAAVRNHPAVARTPTGNTKARFHADSRVGR
jgi:hypothetical protein